MSKRRLLRRDQASTRDSTREISIKQAQARGVRLHEWALPAIVTYRSTKKEHGACS